jgi:hypothetical protein
MTPTTAAMRTRRRSIHPSRKRRGRMGPAGRIVQCPRGPSGSFTTHGEAFGGTNQLHLYIEIDYLSEIVGSERQD